MYLPGRKYAFQETSGMVELVPNGSKKKKFGLKIFSSKSGKVAKSIFCEKKTRDDYKVVIVVMGLVFLKFLITRLNLEISDTFALSDKR